MATNFRYNYHAERKRTFGYMFDARDVLPCLRNDDFVRCELCDASCFYMHALPCRRWVQLGRSLGHCLFYNRITQPPFGFFKRFTKARNCAKALRLRHKRWRLRAVRVYMQACTMWRDHFIASTLDTFVTGPRIWLQLKKWKQGLIFWHL